MFFRTSWVVVSLIFLVWWGIGLLRRQAPAILEPSRPPALSPHVPVADAVLNRDEAAGKGSLLSETSMDINSDFYQTIIKNNLFAPLGTDLNPKQRPGAHLTLLATFVREPPAVSTALIEDRTTGQQVVIAVGESIGDFRLTDVAAKNVRLDYKGEEIRLSLSPIFLLNTKRR